MPHCLAQKSAAAPNSASPMSAMVGAIVSGPMNRSSTPTTPLRPISTWNTDATAIAPWICAGRDEKLAQNKNSRRRRRVLTICEEGDQWEASSKQEHLPLHTRAHDMRGEKGSVFKSVQNSHWWVLRPPFHGSASMMPGMCGYLWIGSLCNVFSPGSC